MLRVDIPPTAHIGVSGSAGSSYGSAGASYTADFGELTQGKTTVFYAVARSTGNYTVKTTTTDGFQMLRAGGGSAVSSDNVDYSVTFDGNALNEAQGASGVTFTSGATSAAGHGHPIEITVGDVSGKRAGDYSSTLTLEITPQS